MGLGKRLYDLARANLNSLVSRKSDEALGDFSDEELAAELQRRQDRRRRQDEARAARRSAEHAARERQSRATSRAGSGKARSSAPPPPAATDRVRLEILYARLETPYGADLEQVKKSFRRLVRKHHPDLAAPGEKRAATERTIQLTAAFDELEAFLEGRPGRRP